MPLRHVPHFLLTSHFLVDARHAAIHNITIIYAVHDIDRDYFNSIS